MTAAANQSPEELLLAAQKELRDMQRAIVALRGELELSHARREQEVQQAVAAGQDEIKLLRATAASLRDALEQAAIKRDSDVQAAHANRHATRRYHRAKAEWFSQRNVCVVR